MWMQSKQKKYGDESDNLLAFPDCMRAGFPSSNRAASNDPSPWTAISDLCFWVCLCRLFIEIESAPSLQTVPGGWTKECFGGPKSLSFWPVSGTFAKRPIYTGGKPNR